MFGEMILRRRRRRELHEILKSMQARFDIPEEYTRNRRLKFKLGRNKDTSDHYSASQFVTPKRTIIQVEPRSDGFRQEATHELGHFLFYSVAGHGDDRLAHEFKRRDENAFLQVAREYDEMVKCLKIGVLFANPSEILAKVRETIGGYFIQEIVSEVFPAYAALLDYPDITPALTSVQIMGEAKGDEESVDRTIDYFFAICKSTPDAFLTQIRDNEISNTIEGIRQQGNMNDLELLRNVMNLGLTFVDLRAHTFAEILAIQAQRRAERYGERQVADMMLGLRDYSSLPGEVRIASPDFNPGSHLVYLVEKFVLGID